MESTAVLIGLVATVIMTILAVIPFAVRFFVTPVVNDRMQQLSTEVSNQFGERLTEHTKRWELWAETLLLQHEVKRHGRDADQR